LSFYFSAVRGENRGKVKVWKKFEATYGLEIMATQKVRDYFGNNGDNSIKTKSNLVIAQRH